MKRSEIALLAIILVAVSVLTYFIHFLIFRDPHHIFIFLVGDIAFVFLEVFLVGLVIERVLARREKRAMLSKLNMIAGAFFSEVGNKLLAKLLECYPESDRICPCLSVSAEWTGADYKNALNYIRNLTQKPRCSEASLDEIKDFLIEKRPFILRLLENPNVLEHEQGSNLIWAVLHLTEELEARSSLGNLPEDDLEYLDLSIHRVYRLVAQEWINYMQYLEPNHPFLFSLIVRIHPFQQQPSPTVAGGG